MNTFLLLAVLALSPHSTTEPAMPSCQHVGSVWVDQAGEAYGTSEDCVSGDKRPMPTVNLSDVPVDDYPVCHVEDCSDVPNQEGLWYSKSTGNWYFEQGEDYTALIVDDTVTR